MGYRIKLREATGAILIRDGRGLAAPVIRVTANEWSAFEHHPAVDDPALIIEAVSIKAPPPAAAAQEPPVKRRRGRPRKVRPAEELS